MGVIHPDYHDIPDRKRATTPMEALMRAPPGDGIDASQMELLKLRDVLEDALEELTEIEREVVLATVIERVPLRELEKRPLGYKKSWLAVIRDGALAKLRKHLSAHPLVLEHIARNHTEEEDDDAREDGADRRSA